MMAESEVFHLRLPSELVDMIEKCFEGRNKADKVKNYLSSPIFSKERLLLEKKILETRLHAINKALKSNIFMNFGNITEAERLFLEETQKIIDKDGKYLYGRKEAYNRQFNKHITTNEFKLLLYELKNEGNNKDTGK